MRILMCFCLFAFLTACSKTKEKENEPPMTVQVFHAEPSVNNGEREFTFISKPYRITDLSFRVGGPILRFDVQSGRFFRKGDIIASIDNRDFIIRRNKAEAVYHQTNSEYNRIEALYHKNNVSGSSYEKAKSDLAIAKAAFETAQNELEDTRLVAPFDGYVQSVYVESHQDVRPSQPIVTFIDLSKVKVEAYLPEGVAMKMRKQPQEDNSHNLAIYFDAMPDKEFHVLDTELSMSTTSNNLSFMLTAILNNSTGELLGGMSGRMLLNIAREKTGNIIYVPQIAICHSPQMGSYVWKLGDDNRVSKVPVVIGNLANGNEIEIREGVGTGDKIVLTGHLFLSENKEVTIQG